MKLQRRLCCEEFRKRRELSINLNKRSEYAGLAVRAIKNGYGLKIYLLKKLRKKTRDKTRRVLSTMQGIGRVVGRPLLIQNLLNSFMNSVKHLLT